MEKKRKNKTGEHIQIMRIELGFFFFLFHLSIFIIAYYFNNGKEKCYRIMEPNLVCIPKKIC